MREKEELTGRDEQRDEAEDVKTFFSALSRRARDKEPGCAAMRAADVKKGRGVSTIDEFFYHYTSYSTLKKTDAVHG